MWAHIPCQEASFFAIFVIIIWLHYNSLVSREEDFPQLQNPSKMVFLGCVNSLAARSLNRSTNEKSFWGTLYIILGSDIPGDTLQEERLTYLDGKQIQSCNLDSWKTENINIGKFICYHRKLKYSVPDRHNHRRYQEDSLIPRPGCMFVPQRQRQEPKWFPAKPSSSWMQLSKGYWKQTHFWMKVRVKYYFTYISPAKRRPMGINVASTIYLRGSNLS